MVGMTEKTVESVWWGELDKLDEFERRTRQGRTVYIHRMKHIERARENVE